MAVVRMGREPERLCVLDRSFDDLHQTSWSDRPHPLGDRHLSDQLLVILEGACTSEGIFHSEAEDIHEKNRKDELSFRLAPCDRQVTDPVVSQVDPRMGLDDRPFLGWL